MIIKSMSRKEPSFDQLVTYMSSEKSDARYDLHLNCFSRGSEDIAREFYTNSQLLAKRRNGNYLYHEIVSLKVKRDQDQKQIKEDLRDIAERYINERSPHNMVYGCLHEDHDHNLHYHLMISANERGERVRLRLSQKQFDTVKRDLETHVLENYSHLEQQKLITAISTSEKMSVKAGEMKRRTGALPQREEIRHTIQEAMSQTNTMHNFSFYLSERGYQFYTRGKNFGVDVHHEDGISKKYRFSTLGIHEEFETFHNDVHTKHAEETHSQARRDLETTKEHLSSTEKIEIDHEADNAKHAESENASPDAASESDAQIDSNETEEQTDSGKQKQAFKESLQETREKDIENERKDNIQDEDDSTL